MNAVTLEADLEVIRAFLARGDGTFTAEERPELRRAMANVAEICAAVAGSLSDESAARAIAAPAAKSGGAASIRARLALLLVRDCKARAGVMARCGFLPSRLWNALREEMKAAGLTLAPGTVGDPEGFPALIIGGVYLYADDCEDSVRLIKRGEEDVKRYAYAALWAFGVALAPPVVGRDHPAAAARDPQGASTPKENV